MNHLQEIESEGFTIINSVFSLKEIENIIQEIDQNTLNKEKNESYRQSADLFVIRQFNKEIPKIGSLIFNQKLKTIISENFGPDFFITKSIYFDKPSESNWFVAYHQDLTISVDKKVILENYKHWTVKQNQFAVQPPVAVLEKNFTIRIHLDTTTTENGALKVINKSHKNGIVRIENMDFEKEKETICEVEKGGLMIMKPLLFHASNKTTNNQRRRVIHIELSNQTLPNTLEWSEKMNIVY